MRTSATRRGGTITLTIDGAEPFYLTLAQAAQLRKQLKTAERFTPSKQRAAGLSGRKPEPEAT